MTRAPDRGRPAHLGALTPPRNSPREGGAPPAGRLQGARGVRLRGGRAAAVAGKTVVDPTLDLSVPNQKWLWDRARREGAGARGGVRRKMAAAREDA
jgi:hypothetical protein